MKCFTGILFGLVLISADLSAVESSRRSEIEMPSNKTESNSMLNEEKYQAVPPEVTAYASGANTAEYLQFEFLIGCWDVEATKVSPQGHMISYSATWDANYINDKRMVIDDFRALSPNGESVSSYITLRTYSPVTNRWEFAGIGAQTAAASMLSWHGTLVGKEMHLHSEGLSPSGMRILNTIRFYEITESYFKWESKMSFDDGKSWKNIGALVAKKRNKR